MKKRKLNHIKAASLEFQQEPMDDYYQNFLLGIPSRWRVKKILQEIKIFKNKTILDVGCEAGYISIKMAERGAKITAIDIIQEALDSFKEKLTFYPQLKKRITIKKLDARKISSKNNFFDVIVATEVIEHMPEIGKFAQEAARILKPKGKLIITFPNEQLREKIYPLVKLLGINTDIEKKVTLFSYKTEDIIKIFKKYFKLSKNYSLPFFLPITFIMVFQKTSHDH